MLQLFPHSTEIAAGRLTLAGHDASDLAERFGTPVIVFDRRTFEERAKAFSAALPADRVFYAGKAFTCIALLELLDSLGLSLDVCTGGELATAAAAGFPGERIIFHGNNKSIAELEQAREYGVGRIAIDSFDEIDRIRKVGSSAKAFVRVTPGVEAHTHEFVQTGQEDSKFGFTLGEDIALEAIKRATELPTIDIVGVHAHIGSQIFELAAFDLAVERLADLLVAARDRFGFESRELNLGGGLGIAHTEDELSPDPTESIGRIASAVERQFEKRDLPMPELAIEPGRSIVGPCAVTLYRVGTVKRIPGVRTYVAVDGGMSDNIRPALYGAKYQAFVAGRMDAPIGSRVTIAGKHCESGDVLIKDVRLPEDVGPGDLIVIPATGAYNYSMANNYNRVPRPPVVMVEEGRATEIVRRETYDDLLRLDHRLPS
jgi:diaminopimelate decarboxylase